LCPVVRRASSSGRRRPPDAPRPRVAKEAGHPDQQLLEQQVDLLRVVPQELRVSASVDAVDRHAPLDPAMQVLGL
jgi:hypothetical protein